MTPLGCAALAVAWLVVGFGVAVAIGRAIRLADRGGPL